MKAGHFIAESFNNEVKNILYAAEHTSMGNYSKQYETWKRARNIIRCFRDELKKKHVERVLDIGCANGSYIFILNSVNSANSHMHFHGLDIDTDKISCAEEVRKMIGLDNVTFGIGEAEDTKLTGGHFDIVLLCEVIEHLMDPHKCLDEIRRVLKPGGLAIITTPNKDNLCRKMVRIFRSSRKSEDESSWVDVNKHSKTDLGHVSVKGLGEWRRIMRESGFRIEVIRRGSFFFGGAEYDEHPALVGAGIILDTILDHVGFLPDLSENITFGLRKI